MRLSIIIYSGDPATIWNAFRMANFDRHSDDEAKVFLLGAGVEAELLGTGDFPISQLVESFTCAGGKSGA